MRYIDENGITVNVEVLGFFKIDELEKEYIMYSFIDENPDNENGKVMIGEVLREDGQIQILGIKDSELELVTEMYKEIRNGAIENE